MKKATKKNYEKVIDNFAIYLKTKFKEADKDDKDFHVSWLNDLLNELRSDDFFGTEGQCDPRGDQRDSD